jgi:response regulator NasT
LIIESQPARLAMLLPALEAADCEVMASLNSARSLDVQVAALRPDIVIIAQDSPDRDTLEHICVANQDCPRPIVMFTDDARPESIRAATQAGVTSYVVDGLDAARIRPILDVAMSRFQAYQALHDELEQTRQQLAERKMIDQAKAQLIRETGASETEIYREMRRAAMDRGVRIVDIARQILQKA